MALRVPRCCPRCPGTLGDSDVGTGQCTSPCHCELSRTTLLTSKSYLTAWWEMLNYLKPVISVLSFLCRACISAFGAGKCDDSREVGVRS